MRRFRLVGLLTLTFWGGPWAQISKAMVIPAHSSLDAGARWKSDPDYYSIGELQTIEDLGANVIIPFSKAAKAIIPKENKPKHKRTGNIVTHREQKPRRFTKADARIEFNF